MAFKLQDNYIKVLVLFMAILLWLYVSSEQNPIVSRSYQIPLSIENQPEGYVFIGVPEKVSISVKSAKNASSGLHAGDFMAKIDLSDAKEGVQYIPVMISAPLGVEISQVRPQAIEVSVDKMSQKSVALNLNLKGQPAQGRQAGTPVLSPASVIVQGPAKQLANLNTINVSLDISKAQNTVKQYVTVRSDTQGVTITPDKVLVTVPVNAVSANAGPVNTSPVVDLPVLANITGTPAQGYMTGQLSIVPAKCKVTGPREVINSLTAVYIQSVDVEGAVESIDREVKLELPRGAVLVQPDKVRLILPILPEVGEQPLTEEEENEEEDGNLPTTDDDETDNESEPGSNQPNSPDSENQTGSETGPKTEDEESTTVNGELMKDVME